MKKRSFHARGFTLAELAIVLVIVGLLLGGLLVPLSAQTDMKSRSDTNKQLSDIRDALIGFATANGRLPCPADRTVATATTNAGIEAINGAGASLSCACTTTTSGIASNGGSACDDTAHGSAVGVLPWATLGLPETDAWGNRFTYRVTLQFARGPLGQSSFWNHYSGASCSPSSNPIGAAFALCSDGDITISSSSGGTVVANQIPAIALSHGKNSAGAYTINGAQIPGATGDEAENANDDINFVSNTSIDDQVTWLSPRSLRGRAI